MTKERLAKTYASESCVSIEYKFYLEMAYLHGYEEGYRQAREDVRLKMLSAMKKAYK